MKSSLHELSQDLQPPLPVPKLPHLFCFQRFKPGPKPPPLQPPNKYNGMSLSEKSTLIIQLQLSWELPLSRVREVSPRGLSLPGGYGSEKGTAQRSPKREGNMGFGVSGDQVGGAPPLTGHQHGPAREEGVVASPTLDRCQSLLIPNLLSNPLLSSGGWWGALSFEKKGDPSFPTR